MQSDFARKLQKAYKITNLIEAHKINLSKTFKSLKNLSTVMKMIKNLLIKIFNYHQKCVKNCKNALCSDFSQSWVNFSSNWFRLFSNWSRLFWKCVETFLQFVQTFLKFVQTFLKFVQTFRFVQTFLKFVQTFFYICSDFSQKTPKGLIRTYEMMYIESP